MFERSKNYLQDRGEDSAIWFHYGKSNRALEGRYKLHISIHPDQFQQYKNAIHELLHQAIDNGVISHYKVCDALIASGENDVRALRQAHNPFIIYLADNFDESYLIKLTSLINKIEYLLANIQSGDKERREKCDLPLTTHVVFRQAFLNSDKEKKTYISSANKKYIDQLESEGNSSICYQSLNQLIHLQKIKDGKNILLELLSSIQTDLSYYQNRQTFFESLTSSKKGMALAACEIFESLKNDLEKPNIDASDLHIIYEKCKNVVSNLSQLNLKSDETGGKFGKIIERINEKVEANKKILSIDTSPKTAMAIKMGRSSS